MSDLQGTDLELKTAWFVGLCRVLIELVDFPVSWEVLKKNVVYGGVKKTKSTIMELRSWILMTPDTEFSVELL
jgi:hypothetical protein